MKRIFVSLLIASIFTASGFAQNAKPKKVVKPTVSTAEKPIVKQQGLEVPFVNKVLANGFEIIVLADNSVPLVTIELVARNGSITEPLELNGLSHLYEHMFFKPNGAIVDGEEYLRDIDQLGIVYNGTTREEVVNYYFTTTSPYLDTAMRYMKDSALRPTFNEEEFASEKQVVIGEIDRNESNPFFYLSRTMSDKLFSKYPTRKNPLGTRETVNAATTEKMRLIQSRYYVPNNSALIVTGDVKPAEVFAIAEKYFGVWKRRSIDPFKEFPLVEHPPLKKSEGFIVEQPVNNVLIQVGWHGPSIGKDDAATYAADVFSYILGQPDSRFQRNLVDSGLTNIADITYYTQRNVGPITLTLAVSPEKAKEAIRVAHAEIAKFNETNYFTNEELENAKSLLESRDLFEREKLSEYAHTLGFWWSSTGIEYFRGYQKNLRAVSREDIKRYVSTYIQNKPRIGVALISSEAQSKIKLSANDLTGVK